MTLNEETLGEATKARDQLIDLQHKAEVARVDYHHLIRQLHAKGGSLREIAEALGLSHQRVHQIVEPVDGSTGHGPGRGPFGPGGPGGRGPHGHMHRLHRRFRGFMPFERFSDEARQVIVDAIETSGSLGHRRVGTEHLVVGVLSAPAESVAAKALTSLGVTKDAALAAVTARLGSAQPGGPGRRPLTPAVRRVLERALGIASERGEEVFRAHHILLGISADAGDGAAILAELGADGAKLAEAVDTAAK